MSAADIAYRELCRSILDTGERHENRTGVATHRLWGWMSKMDLTKGFPLLTQKKMPIKSAFAEMIGFCRGETDVRWYQNHGCKVWNGDHERWHGKDLDRDMARREKLRDMQVADSQMARNHPIGGDPIAWTYGEKEAREAVLLDKSIAYRQHNPHSLGRIYGAQWRSFSDSESDGSACDQLKDIVDALIAGSNSRRLIMSAWAPDEFHLMSLPPCHVAYHFTKRGSFVDVAMWQRSCDTALGVPYNWANTALITHLIGHAAGLTPGRMVWFGDDVHVYEPHIAALETQFSQQEFPDCQLKINAPAGTMPWKIEPEQLEVVGYQSSNPVKFELFVG